ncbi:MAG: FAD-linked oxidase C-terminal domain-containing protein, partial [Chloroflexota bacterium]
LPNGEVIWTGSKTVKNVSGYDLTHLFVGSEGTLGVVTKIIVKLIPLPEAKMTLLAIYDHIDDAARTVSSIVARRIIPTTLEMLDRATMELVEAYKPVGLPLDAEAVLLLEIDGSEAEAKRQASLVEEACRSCKAREVRVARSKEESDQLWSARRSALAAVARGCVTMIIEDATVPRSAVPEFVRIIGELARKHRLRVPLLAHAGDGNMHPMVMTDFRDQEEMARVDAFADELFRAALDLGGTLSGEHGIGTLKAKYLAWQFGPAGVAAMHAIKRALDPNNILNPGKIFVSDQEGV